MSLLASEQLLTELLLLTKLLTKLVLLLKEHYSSSSLRASAQKALLLPEMVDVGAIACSDNRLLISGLPAQNISSNVSS